MNVSALCASNQINKTSYDAATPYFLQIESKPHKTVEVQQALLDFLLLPPTKILSRVPRLSFLRKAGGFVEARRPNPQSYAFRPQPSLPSRNPGDPRSPFTAPPDAVIQRSAATKDRSSISTPRYRPSPKNKSPQMPSNGPVLWGDLTKPKPLTLRFSRCESIHPPNSPTKSPRPRSISHAPTRDSVSPTS
jgi:hypothetical protein